MKMLRTFPNILADNKNPTAYGTDGEYRTKQTVLSLPKGQNSNISLWDTLGGASSIQLCSVKKLVVI